MGKKVSALLFRVTKFNNYRNIWVFNYKVKVNFVLNYYYKIHKVFNNMLLNIKTFYFNYIYKVCGKLIISKTNHRFVNKFVTIYRKNNFNVFMCTYKLNTSYISPHLIKLFIKFNLVKHISVQTLYNKLYTTLLTEYLHYNSDFLGLKIIISGRLSNTKLANSETFQIGFLPLQQFDIFIFYEKFHVLTKYGLLGIKLWLGKKLVI